MIVKKMLPSSCGEPNCKGLLKKWKKAKKKYVSNSTPKHTDLVLAGSFNGKLERFGEQIKSGKSTDFCMKAAEKGLIPNGSLFLDAKHCFRSFRNELNVEQSYNTFFIAEENKQTHSQRKVQPVITVAFQ